MADNAGLDPLQDRFYAGYIAAVKDLLNLEFVEETEESDD